MPQQLVVATNLLDPDQTSHVDCPEHSGDRRNPIHGIVNVATCVAEAGFTLSGASARVKTGGLLPRFLLVAAISRGFCSARVPGVFKKANAEVLAERERIAARVRDELTAAGLVVVPQTTNTMMWLRQGAEVTVDDDDAGGVVIGWECHPVLRDRAQQVFIQKRYDDPGFLHHGAAQQAMLTAMTKILTSAGFTVVDNPDDMNPLTLSVQAAPTPNAPLTWEPLQESASLGIFEA